MADVIKILHIEDIPTDAELIHRELKAAGLKFEVRVVDTRDAYESELACFKPDIILSDHSLPFFNSYQALCTLQTFNINIPFILVTATVSEEFAVSIIKNGATDYILKDRPQRLPSAIIKAIEAKKIETEHQHFMQEIVSNETLMNDAQALANFGSFSITWPSQNIKISNEAYYIFGFQPGEGVPVCSFYFNNGSTNIEELNISISEVGISLRQSQKNYTLIDKNGRLKFISAEFRVQKNNTGEITGIRGFLYNITRLKSAENMLQQSEANLKTIFETTDTGYILFASDGKIVSFNQKAASFVKTSTGLNLKERLDLDEFAPTDRKAAIHEIFKKAMQGESTTYENDFVAADNEVKWYFSRWLPVTGNNKRNHGVILVISDVTERKLAEIEREKISADLIAQNTALEKFTYIVSHNLRAPVANIMGISAILKSSINTQTQETTQFLEALTTSVTNLDAIVHDLNRILRISRQAGEQKQVVYFQQIVEDVKANFFNVIQQTQATITTHFFEPIYTVSIRSFIHNIFLNLVSNSLAFHKPGVPPAIHISSSLKANRYLLSFSDNGTGIDLTRFGNKIFGLYQKFETASAGKGMGLCIVKTLVDSMGGTIKVSSVVNEGTTFTIELPLEK